MSRFVLLLTGPDDVQTFPIPLGMTTIGRQPDNDIVLNYRRVSRKHACLHCTERDCQIVDLASANGTKLNGEQLPPQEPAVLHRGDRIKIGPCELILEKALAEEKMEALVPITQPVTQSKDRDVSIVDSNNGCVPPGLSRDSRRLLPYLPGIYHTAFMSRFLALFESILLPVEWNIANFELFLDPSTAPAEVLPWLASFFDILFDDSWSEERRRALLKQAGLIYARRGTRWALQRVLEIYTGQRPEIRDVDKELPPFSFRVRLPAPDPEVDVKLIKALIDMNKPAHTAYTLEIMKK